MRSSTALAGLTIPAVALSFALTGPAAADPKGEVVELDCGSTTFEVAVSGNGMFSPGHLTNDTAMLVPVVFGEFEGVITDEDGNVVEEFSEPSVSKGPGAAALADVTCTFTVSGTFEDPELGTLTFSGTGTASGFLTPRR